MPPLRPRLLAALALSCLLLTACAAPAPAPTATTTPAPAPQLEPTPTPEPVPQPQPTTPPEPTAVPAQPSAHQPEATEPAVELSLPDVLRAAFPAAPQAAGEVIYLVGRALDVNGNPLPGMVVEIWQTDASGIYNHPGDRNTARRDPTFQFFGQAVTAADGLYMFRTVLPGEYEPRPRHIHVKVKQDGAELLTTQFYFIADQSGVQGEGVFVQAGDLGKLLFLQPIADADIDGSAILSNDLVIDTGIGTGALTSTPRQAEGPYYPVTPISDYDNDLTVLP